MKLTRSGGLAGISLVASVDVDELPEETAEQVRAALEELDFDAPPAAAPPGAADVYQYDLVVTGGGTRSTSARDPFLGPGMRALVDALLPFAEPQ